MRPDLRAPALLLASLLLAAGCREKAACGPDAPCPAGSLCREGKCGPAFGRPPAPALRGATVLAGAPGQGPRVRVLGTAVPGAQVQLFLGGACDGAPAAAGAAEQLVAPGLDLAAPAGDGLLEVRAVATDPGGRSDCSAPLQMLLAEPARDPDSWKKAGFPSLQAARDEWARSAAAQRALGAALPPELRAALDQARLSPIAQLGRLKGRAEALISADLDADGARDYALIVIPRATRLGAALAAALAADAPAPPDPELGPLLAELRRISLDGGSEVAVALRRGAGFEWLLRPGNGLASAGPWAARDLCLPEAGKLADLEWLAARKADAIEYLVGESAGSGWIAWDARGGKLADLPDRCP